MISKIYHLADIHIRPFQRLDEYSFKLNETIEKIKKDIGDCDKNNVRIVISGDITHNKLNISNELIVAVSSWIRQLEQLAKVIVISGNHDLMVGNLSRMDTLTAVFKASQFENAIHLDSYLGYDSGIMYDENVTWALYSIFTDYRKPDIDKAKKIMPNNTIVGLYHGPIVGASLNNGTNIDSGVNSDIFDGCDFVAAGDIHKRQEIKRCDISIVYPGSLIQQTFGESVSNHGFIVWDLENKTHKAIDLSDDYSLYDFAIKDVDDIDNNKEKLINFV